MTKQKLKKLGYPDESSFFLGLLKMYGEDSDKAKGIFMDTLSQPDRREVMHDLVEQIWVGSDYPGFVNSCAGLLNDCINWGI